MSRQPKLKYAILIPKNDEAKKRLEYHGNKWLLKSKQEEVKFTRDPGPYLWFQSRDGSKCICIKEKEDKDFSIRIID